MIWGPALLKKIEIGPGPGRGPFWSNPPTLLAKAELSRDVFLTSSGTSQLKHLVLRAFLEDVLNMLILEHPSHTFG